MSIQKESDDFIDYGDLAVTGGISVFSPEFDREYYYEGGDLGLTYGPDGSFFRLWAPTASEAYVVLYSEWNSEQGERMQMARDVKGTWTVDIPGDLQGKYYTYQVRIGSQWNEAADPYAKAVGVNGDRAAIIRMEHTNPAGWPAVKPAFQHAVDAVIYELHIRDYTIHPDSGIRHKGKYLGLAEKGTRGPGNIATGLDHMKNLGITHVELLPFYDFATESVDETRLDEPQYNWGYDPKNYNVPEGSYATDPYRPEVRIRELKEMIRSFHEEGIRVIMDVVYNHVYDGYLVNFTKLVPGYYLRYRKDGKFSNGSGCGNDVASERPMVRKFIIDSVLHWVKEYRVDGFRFDLMGLLDIETMNEIRSKLNEVDHSILTIGEGWIMETELAAEKRANQLQAKRLPGIGHFNDGFRDAVKGDIFVFDRKGFISGEHSLADKVKQGITAGIPYGEGISSFAAEPEQNVNYVECHDNHTLWDKLALSAGEDGEDTRRAMHRLASALILTSQGIPFLHAGQEFYRSKNGEENSYKSGDEVNRLDWEQAALQQEGSDYIRELIRLRKKHPAFRMRDAEAIRHHLRFEAAPPLAVAYTLREHANGDPEEYIYVLHHAGRSEAVIRLPGHYTRRVLFGGEMIRELDGNILKIDGIGTVILAWGKPAAG